MIVQLKILAVLLYSEITRCGLPWRCKLVVHDKIACFTTRNELASRYTRAFVFRNEKYDTGGAVCLAKSRSFLGHDSFQPRRHVRGSLARSGRCCQNIINEAIPLPFYGFSELEHVYRILGCETRISDVQNTRQYEAVLRDYLG